MPCPVDEPCDGSVGTDWPLAEKGHWENMGPRALIDGGDDTNASVAWWDAQHLQQGVRTDSDGNGDEIKMARRRRRRRRRRLHSGTYQQHRNLKDDVPDDMSNKLTKSEYALYAARALDFKQREERLKITKLLHRRFSVPETVTRNAFRAADLDGSGFIEAKRSRRAICEAYPKNVRRMLKLPVYVNEEDGAQVWCRKECPKPVKALAEESAEDDLTTSAAIETAPAPSGAGSGDEAVCDCNLCRDWERTEYTELAARYVHPTYFIPDPLFNTRKTYSDDGQQTIVYSEIDVEYYTMSTQEKLTDWKIVAAGQLEGHPSNICVGDTTVKCGSNKQCTAKGLDGGCQPHPSEASVGAMDMNRDGRISYEELVESVNVNMKQSFDIIDANSDENMTLEELNAFISTMWPLDLDPLARYKNDEEYQVELDIFLTTDWDGSGGLDIAEYVFLYSNTEVDGEDKTKSRTLSPLELMMTCKQSTDLMWNEPIGRPIFRVLCGGPNYEIDEEILKPKKMNMDWIQAKNKSMAPYFWRYNEVWPTGVDPSDLSKGVPVLDPTEIPLNATQEFIDNMPLSVVKRNVIRLNNDDDETTLNFHEVKNSIMPPGHLDPSLKGPVRDPVSNQSSYCFWKQAHCLPGEFLDYRNGECRLVTNASETQLFECTTGMRFYRCPLGDISCPGSSRICYETNKPPLVCEKDTTLSACLKCRAAESAAITAQNKAAEEKLLIEGSEESLTEGITTGEDFKRRRIRRIRRSLSNNGTAAGNASNGGNIGTEELRVYSASGNTNAMCRWGYEGPMCNKCILGYWKTPADTCERCKTSSEDSQRGDRNLQMYIYVGGGSFGSVCMLIALALYLRQDSGACLCACCIGCARKCKKKKKSSDRVKVTPISQSHSGKAIEEKLAKRWFRPEKFKIMLSFFQIFSQMNNNYGVNWPTITADYMRLLAIVNIDIVKLAALDCLFRSNFYFSLTMMCVMPFGLLAVLMFYMWLGRSCYMRSLAKNHRKCIMTGKEVKKPMSAKFYLATRLRVANSVLGNQEFVNAKARKEALKLEMDSNKTNLPVGSFVVRTCEMKRADQVRTLSQTELSDVLQHNINAFRQKVIQRLEYLRFTNKIWKLFFWALLLIYPSISTRVLRTFACTQIGKVWVLRFDRSVECYSFKWYLFSFGAAGAGVVFVWGIPALFFYLLWKARNTKVARNWEDCIQSPKRLTQLLKEAEEDAKIMREHFQLDKDGDGDPSMEEKKYVVENYLKRKNMRFHRTYERLGFLYYAYNEDHWWYEIVELSRKLILNGVIVLVPEAVTARVMVGLLTCLFYCLVVNLVRPYTANSDFTLQNLCHTQLFITMFAALLIKAEVPILGFSPHLRPIEANFCGWVVVISHAFVSMWGFTNIVHERFFSSEAIRHAATKKKAAHELKQRMSKFKRAKKKLMTKVRAGSMFGGGGILGGLSELGAMMGSSSQSVAKKRNAFKKSEENTTAEQSVAGSTNNMLLGALMSSDNIENHGSLLGGGEDGGGEDDGGGGGNGDENGLDFAWPGKEQDHSDDAVSSDSAVSTPPSSDNEGEEEEGGAEAKAADVADVADDAAEGAAEDATAGAAGAASAADAGKDAEVENKKVQEKLDGDKAGTSTDTRVTEEETANATSVKDQKETKTTDSQNKGSEGVKKVLEVADLSSDSSDDSDSSSDSDDDGKNNF